MVVDVQTLNEPGWLTPMSSERMRSRFVRLEPGEEIGGHVNKEREEIIIFLGGVAEVQLHDEPVQVSGGQTIFIPNNTPHNIKNIGDSNLEYVYVTASFQPLDEDRSPRSTS